MGGLVSQPARITASRNQGTFRDASRSSPRRQTALSWSIGSYVSAAGGDTASLDAELEALKAELVAACVKVVQEQQRPILDRVDQVIAGFEHTQQALVALVDRHLH